MAVNPEWVKIAMAARSAQMTINPYCNRFDIEKRILEAVAPLIHNAAIEAAAGVAEASRQFSEDAMREFEGKPNCEEVVRMQAAAWTKAQGIRGNIRALAEPLPQEQAGPDNAEPDDGG